MTDINHVILVGRVTRDCGSDERSFGYVGANGTARANVSIAVNRSRKDASGQWNEETSFFDVTIWGKTAENLKQYLVKGKQILVDGHLRQDRWEKDGQKFNKVYIIAENVQLLGGGKGGSGGGAASGGYAGGAASGGQSYQSSANAGASAPSAGYDGGAADSAAPFPEDIPF